MIAIAFAQNIRFPLKARGNDELFCRHPRMILSGIHALYSEDIRPGSNLKVDSRLRHAGMTRFFCRHPRMTLSGIHVSKGATS